MPEIRRKLYRRGSSYETTIPMPMLFALDKNRRYHVVFNYDAKMQRWYVNFEEMQEKKLKKVVK